MKSLGMIASAILLALAAVASWVMAYNSPMVLHSLAYMGLGLCYSIVSVAITVRLFQDHFSALSVMPARDNLMEFKKALAELRARNASREELEKHWKHGPFIQSEHKDRRIVYRSTPDRRKSPR